MTATINNWQDGLSVTGAASSDSPINFSLLGGRYLLIAAATWSGGNLVLNAFAPDGSTVVNVATWTANATDLVDLPAGEFQFTITTATAVQFSFARVPLGRGA